MVGTGAEEGDSAGQGRGRAGAGQARPGQARAFFSFSLFLLGLALPSFSGLALRSLGFGPFLSFVFDFGGGQMWNYT